MLPTPGSGAGSGLATLPAYCRRASSPTSGPLRLPLPLPGTGLSPLPLHPTKRQLRPALQLSAHVVCPGEAVHPATLSAGSQLTLWLPRTGPAHTAIPVLPHSVRTWACLPRRLADGTWDIAMPSDDVSVWKKKRVST